MTERPAKPTLSQDARNALASAESPQAWLASALEQRSFIEVRRVDEDGYFQELDARKTETGYRLEIYTRGVVAKELYNDIHALYERMIGFEPLTEWVLAHSATEVQEFLDLLFSSPNVYPIVIESSGDIHADADAFVEALQETVKQIEADKANKSAD